MATIERVKLADMRPNPKNPRTKFNGLKELAASFACNADNPGEPYTPPIVVRDASVYRIVDGERRYRAMVEAGVVESCLCTVFDDISDANAVAAMVATDDKEKLTVAERSVGVQQMLLLGLDDDAVSAIARIDAGRVKDARRAVSVIGKPLQLDLNVLMEVSEVEDDAVREELIGLAENGDTGWDSEFAKRKREAINSQRERKRELAFMNALISEGIDFSGDDPGEGWRFAFGVYSPDGVADAVPRLERDYPDDEWQCWLKHPEDSGYGWWRSAEVRFYVSDGAVSASAAELEEEKAARAEAAASARDMSEMMVRELVSWFDGDAFRSDDECRSDAEKELFSLIWEAVDESYDADRLVLDLASEFKWSPEGLKVVPAWVALDIADGMLGTAELFAGNLMVGGQLSSYELSNASDWLEVADAMTAALNRTPTGFELTITEKLRDVLA